MKRFYYTDRPDTRSRKGDRIIRVYALKAGIMEQVAHTTYRTGSTKGATAEAFSALIRAGIIPQKWENSSACSWSGPGYFAGPVTKVYDIQEIY